MIIFKLFFELFVRILLLWIFMVNFRGVKEVFCGLDESWGFVDCLDWFGINEWRVWIKVVVLLWMMGKILIFVVVFGVLIVLINVLINLKLRMGVDMIKVLLWGFMVIWMFLRIFDCKRVFLLVLGISNLSEVVLFFVVVDLIVDVNVFVIFLVKLWCILNIWVLVICCVWGVFNCFMIVCILFILCGVVKSIIEFVFEFVLVMIFGVSLLWLVRNFWMVFNICFVLVWCNGKNLNWELVVMGILSVWISLIVDLSVLF